MDDSQPGGMAPEAEPAAVVAVARPWAARSSLRLRQWVKERNSPSAVMAHRFLMAMRHVELPVIRPVHLLLYHGWVGATAAVRAATRILWFTPLFQARLVERAPRLYLDGGMPLVMGPLVLRFGRDCRVSGQTTFTGRTSGDAVPELIVGSNVFIGWQTTIAVGRRVVLGDNVRIAGRALLAGYPGHPLDPVARAAGQPETPDQVGDIVLEDGVWLATGVSVVAGVRIGRGTVVATGSVVTRDLPAGVLAAGVPARPIRLIEAPARGQRA